MFSQIIFSNKGFVANVAFEISFTMCCFMLSQGAQFCKTFGTKRTVIGQFFGVRSMMSQELGFVA